MDTADIERQRFVRWARSQVRKRARRLRIPFHEDHVAHFVFGGYDLVFLAGYMSLSEQEDGSLVEEWTPLTWVHIDKPETEVVGNDTFSIELKEPHVESVVPDLVFVLTPEGDPVYRK